MGAIFMERSHYAHMSVEKGFIRMWALTFQKLYPHGLKTKTNTTFFFPVWKVIFWKLPKNFKFEKVEKKKLGENQQKQPKAMWNSNHNFPRFSIFFSVSLYK